MVFLISDRRLQFAARIKQSDVCRFAVVSFAVNGLLLSKMAKTYLIQYGSPDYLAGDDLLIPRNHRLLVQMVKELGASNVGEQVHLVPIKPKKKYAVLADGDHAFEWICEDHKVWGSRIDHHGKPTWVWASQDHKSQHTNGYIVTVKH